MGKAYIDKDDVKRASFQYAGHFALFRHTRTAGVDEYMEEDFKGYKVDSVVNSKRTFEAYVSQRVNTYLKAAVEA